jgi:hypothetical protein
MKRELRLERIGAYYVNRCAGVMLCNHQINKFFYPPFQWPDNIVITISDEKFFGACKMRSDAAGYYTPWLRRFVYINLLEGALRFLEASQLIDKNFYFSVKRA